MHNRLKLLLKRFSSDETGAVAMIFGLMSIVLVFMAGMAIDFNRIVNMRARVTDAVDAASLAAGRALLDGKLSDEQIVAMATAYFNENVKSARLSGTVEAPTVTVDRANSSVTIDVKSQIPMTLTRLGGFTNVDLPVSSSAVFEQKDIEVGMALDVTGSMNDVVGGQTKIKALKDAFANFVERVIPAQQNPAHRVRIGLAPYSAGINVGSYSKLVSQDRSLDGCVTERKSGQETDGTDPFLVAQDGTRDIDMTQGIYTFECPTPSILPLTENKDELINTVKNYAAKGGTAGHLGVQWAWNLVSDQWGTIFQGDSAPDSYQRVKDGKLLKAVVLMTDGVFNTAFHGNKSMQQAIALCDGMKAKGVTVFSVGFGLDSEPDVALRQKAKQMLQNCATPGSDYFADASDSAELDAAFQKFASKLTELRLAK